MPRRRTVSNNYKPAIRKQKAVLGTSVKVIIALLIVIVITLAAFLIKIIASQALKPNIVYPPERPDTDTEETPYTRPADTEAETSLETRTVEGSKYDPSDGTLILVNKRTAYSMPAEKEKEKNTDIRGEASVMHPMAGFLAISGLVRRCFR